MHGVSIHRSVDSVDSGCLLLVEQSNDIEDIEDIERWNIHEISYNILVSRDDLF